MLKLDSKKIQLLMAERCLDPYDLCTRARISYPSYQRLIKSENCKLSTLGKLAKALEVGVTEIVKEETA